MADEEVEKKFEKKIEFILEQQAQFAVDLQQLREVIQQLHEAQSQTGQLVNRLAAVTLEGFKDVNAKINALVDSQVHIDERFKDMTVKIDALVDSQVSTDERLKDVTVKIDALADSQVRTDERFKDVTVKIGALADSQALTDERLKDVTVKIGALVDSQVSTDERLKDVTVKIDALADSQARLTQAQVRTDKDLRNLIAVVDRFFRERRNGWSEE
jgi:chaperonin cofactor prefoldin